MLSCQCGYDDFDWFFYPPEDFTKLNSNRRKRCISCNQLIDINTDCLVFDCYRDPCSDIEERIYGDEVPMANKYMCEKCGEIFLNLDALGYCMSIGHDIREDLADYWDITGFHPR